MRSTRRLLAALAMVALIGVISAGCSSASAGTDTGSGGGNDTQTSEVSTATMRPAGTDSSAGNTTAATAPAQTGTVAAAATRQQAVKFAQCMRANGVKQFPDPGPSGELTIDQIANGSSLDTNSAAFKQAISACRDLEPPGFTGQKRSAQQQENALKFAQCMRDNGVKDFPDPSDTAPLIDTSRIPSAAGKGARSIPGFNAAVQKCREYLAGALKDPGASGGQ